MFGHGNCFSGRLRGLWGVLLCKHASAIHPSGSLWRGARTGLSLDQRLLGLEQRSVCVGSRPVGPPAAPTCNMGRAPLGKEGRPLSAPRRSLEVVRQQLHRAVHVAATHRPRPEGREIGAARTAIRSDGDSRRTPFLPKFQESGFKIFAHRSSAIRRIETGRARRARPHFPFPPRITVYTPVVCRTPIIRSNRWSNFAFWSGVRTE